MICVELKNVYKAYGKKCIINDLSLTIPDGSTLFLLGLNGAGKTTILRLIMELIQPDSGEINFSNNSVARNIGAMISSPMFFDGMTAYENLRYYAMAWNCPTSQITRVLETVGLCEATNKKVKTFSSGMKQRLAIARAFLSEPKLLLLDEPMNGLDPAGIADLKSILKGLRKSKKNTTIISSHLIEETRDLATHYAILHNGRIISAFNASKSEDVLSCLKFDSFGTLKSVCSIYPHLYKGYYVSDRGCLLFLNHTVLTDLKKFQSTICSEHGIASDLEIATLSEYFLGITGGSHG